MKQALLTVLTLMCGLSTLACGGDDDDDGSGGSANMAGTNSAGTNSSGGSNGSGGSSAGPVSERCREGCMLVIDADCPISPDSQESCESDCQENETGECASEYGAFQDCAEGKAITCTALGIPGVEGCEAEQNAFIACL